ncbi:PR domain zinc finger protein 5-like isoform X2 [Maniola hyperantus]|uniref:PR domain zinc finger protein 5-like isoform X2 n=1 Tax=Aphantopus hyperantus TaxID=2795564 RepID=UPI001567CA4D|nr:PR domain zinc finger protein 5-like [Maniola hyperantus]
MQCCVPSCGVAGDSYLPSVLGNQERVTYHEFPTIPWLRQSWLVRVGIQECYLPQGAVVCSQHFEKGDFRMSRGDVMKLRKYSVPSVRVPEAFTTQEDKGNNAMPSLPGVEDQMGERAYPGSSTAGVGGISGVKEDLGEHPCGEAGMEGPGGLCGKEGSDGIHSQPGMAAPLFCLICLDTGASKLFPLNKNHLARAYTNITGLEVNIVRHHINTIPKLCVECAQRLTNCDTFKYKTMKAHSVLNQLLRRDKSITSQSLKSVDRIGNLLTSNIMKHTFKPDHYDVYLIHNDENNIILKQEDIVCNSKENTDLKREKLDETMYDYEKSETTYEIEYLNEFDDINSDDTCYKSDIKNIINEVNNKDKINTDIRNDKSDIFVTCDNDGEAEFLDDDIDDDIDDEIKRENDIGGDIDEVLNDNYSSDEVLSKSKVKIDSKNRTACNDKKRKRKTKEATITTVLIEKIKSAKTIEKQNSRARKKVVERKRIKKNDTKSKTTKKTSKKVRVSRKKIERQFIGPEKRKHVRKPKKPDSNEKNTFTRTVLTYEEQIAEIQKRKETKQYKMSPYRCEMCFKGFFQLVTYNQHMDRHSDKFGQYECAICGGRFKTRNPLAKHLVYHREKFRCKLCPYSTSTISLARHHERWHSGKTFKCQLCEAEFGKITSYFSHKRIKHPSDSVCALCGFSFISPAGVKAHIHLKHPFDDINNLSGPSCEECNIRFASETAYQQHMEVSPKHAISGELKRNTPRQLPNYYSFYRDKPRKRPLERPREKSGERPRGRPRAGSRERSHEGSRLCEQCGKGFPSPWLLRKHSQVHTGEKMFKCEICDKGFMHKTTLKDHVLNTHSDNPPRFPCGVCHKEFSFAANRRRHMSIHEDTKYKCDICDKTFASRPGRDQHVSHVHLNVPRPKRNRRDRHSSIIRRPSIGVSD